MDTPHFDLGSEPSSTDLERVADQLGHVPRGQFSIVVRDADGQAVVLRNAPLMYDGTPMPTLYWLAGADQIRAIGKIESAGGVDQAEAEVDAQALEDAHNRYRQERDVLIPENWQGPRPSGGVGGTRRGVKCLHAHYAYLLAGGVDPVGNWLVKQLRAASKHP